MIQYCNAVPGLHGEQLCSPSTEYLLYNEPFFMLTPWKFLRQDKVVFCPTHNYRARGNNLRYRSLDGGRGITETYDTMVDVDPDQPRTATAEDSIDNDVLKRPKNDSKRKDENRCLVLVIAGRAGVGKSTVLNNLLGLKGENAAAAKSSARSVTKDVKCYEEEKYGVPVRIIDTPGLESKDLTSEEEQEALSRMSDENPDLLLYCISLAERFQKDDDRIVEKLTKAFGSEIWSRTVLVLTFGDVKLEGSEEDKREVLENNTEEFEKALKNAGVSDVSVKYMLSTQDINIQPDLESAKPEIVGIPVGRYIETPPDWVFLLFTEVIKRCRLDALLPLLKLRGITQQMMAELIMKVGSVDKARSIALGIGGVGALLGVGAAGTVGAAVGGAGGIVGAISGAVTGALESIFGRKKVNEPFELTVLAMMIEARLKAEQQKKEEAQEKQAAEQQKEEAKVKELELKKRNAEELKRKLEEIQKEIKELEEDKS